MKFYQRDPDAAFAGMAGLTLEQIGAYTLILDRLYAVDGVMPDNDGDIAHALHLDPRLWKRLKRELMAKGKIRITTAGMVTANGVDKRLLLAQVRSTSAKHAVDVRWTNYRKTKENNEPVIRPRNTSKIEKKITTTAVGVQEVDNGDDDFGNPNKSINTSIASGELNAIVRAKGWR
jgi:uncharacterized protein YdaU (DUF1376 family)